MLTRPNVTQLLRPDFRHMLASPRLAPGGAIPPAALASPSGPTADLADGLVDLLARWQRPPRDDPPPAAIRR
jgi:hypothetical protein